MSERIPTKRQVAQEKFKKEGGVGFVEDFVEEGADDLKFMAMPDKRQNLWNEVVETDPSLIEGPPFFG